MIHMLSMPVRIKTFGRIRKKECRMTTRLRFVMLATIAIMMLALPTRGQTKLVLNGAVITMQNGAQIVIANGAANAIVRNSGFINSQDQASAVKWMIGTNTGSYIIPWGNATQYLPLSFNPSGATGSGYFLLGTYALPNWNNSAALPTGITHFNNAQGVDHSAFSSDRFWRIDAVNYTAKPNLSALTFTYAENENFATGNTIAEGALRAERWNSTSNSWTDNILTSSVNTTANTVTVNSVGRADLFAWWNLSTTGSNKYWVSSGAGSWSDNLNWSFTPGGAGGAGIPASTDAVFFDGANDGACSVAANITASNIIIQAGYSGTISQNANSISVLNDISVGGGNFQGGSGQISIGRDLQITSGSFTATSGTLSLGNSLTFSGGVFLHNQGVIEFTGTPTSPTQSVQGSSKLSVNNVRVDNGTHSSTLLIDGQVDVNGVVTMSANSELDADGIADTGILTLVSSTDELFNNAAIAAIPSSASLTGDVTVQRFMSIEGPNNFRIYRYIGSPVSDGTVSDLQNEIPITGSFTGTSLCATCGATQSMFEYNENVITDSNGNGVADNGDGYADFPQSVNSEILSPGKGYSMFVRGNNLGSARWDLRGTVNMGNLTPIVLPVSFTSSGTVANDGWNLVSNPYPSTIDWASPAWTKGNLENSIYIRDNGSLQARFASYNGVVGTNGGSRYIALGQAFWVKANSSNPVLSASEDVKAPSQPATFFRDEAVSNVFRVTMKQGKESDEAVIHFRDDATPGFDPQADAWKMFNLNFNLNSSGLNNEKLSINSWSQLICTADIALSVEKTKSGDYVLEFDGFSTMVGAVQVLLVDKYLNSTTTVTPDLKYSFSVSSDPLTGGSRFVLQFTKTPDPLLITQDGSTLSVDYKSNIQWYLNGEPIEGATYSQLNAVESGTYSAVVLNQNCELSGELDVIVTGRETDPDKIVAIFPNPVIDRVTISIKQPAVVTVLNAVGQTVTVRNIMETTELDLSNVPAGVYVLIVSTPDGVVSTKIVKN
jgi:hypothetical protein